MFLCSLIALAIGVALSYLTDIDGNAIKIITALIFFASWVLLWLALKIKTAKFTAKHSIRAKLISKTIKTCTQQKKTGFDKTSQLLMEDDKDYYLVFETQEGDRIPLSMDLENGAKIPLDEWGDLSYTKRHLLKFEGKGFSFRDY